MLELRRNRAKRACILSILLIIATINISDFSRPILTQEQPSEIQKFSLHPATDPTAFISIWDTTKLNPGSSNSHSVRLPLESDGMYNFKVDWGDENNDTITIWNSPGVTHTYAVEGIYTINITGTIVGWRFNNVGDCLKILEIQQWGCLQLQNSGGYFYGCRNLNLTAIDNLNLTGTTDLSDGFRSCENFGNGNLDSWDVSSVTNMSRMFYGAWSFNRTIGNWDVSNVIDMSWMFYYAALFNQPIGDWTVSNVRDMDHMFAGAMSFNQCIGNWDVSSVTDMSAMFYGAELFDQSIRNWDVSSVTDMSEMFLFAISFNQPIGNWNVSNVIYMNGMFYHASSFNQPIGSWNVINVINMNTMFNGTALSTVNYDNLLIGWSRLSLQEDVSFDGGNSKFSVAVINVRQGIIANFGWKITDGGLDISSIIGYDLIVLMFAFGLVIVFIRKKKFAKN